MLRLEIRLPNSTAREYSLGPHTPRHRTQDLDRLHLLWLGVTADPRLAGAHLYHVAAALEEFDRQLHSSHREQMLDHLWQELQKRSDDRA